MSATNGVCRGALPLTLGARDARDLVADELDNHLSVCTYVVADELSAEALEALGMTACVVGDPALARDVDGNAVVVVGGFDLPADVRPSQVSRLLLPPPWKSVAELLQYVPAVAGSWDSAECEGARLRWLSTAAMAPVDSALTVAAPNPLPAKDATVLAKHEPSPFASAEPLAPGCLSVTPTPRDYLLRWATRDGKPAAPRMGDGFAPMGVAGFLSAEGGVGKSTLLMMLGVCIVTGRPWIGYHVDTAHVGQRVCMVLGEESMAEVHRRLFNIAEHYQLTEAERRLVERQLTVLPMAGRPCALAVVVNGIPAGTAALAELLQLLRGSTEPWALVVLDPLARLFPLAESDNQMATFSMQLVEQLADVPGHPLALNSHHSSKFARRSGDVDARGVTGLTDAARWALSMKSVAGGFVEFMQSKANYSMPMLKPVTLTRERGGILRLVSDAELQDRQDAAGDAIAEQAAADADKLFEAMRGRPVGSKAAAAAIGRMRAGRARTAIDLLLSDGRAVQDGYRGPYVRADEARTAGPRDDDDPPPDGSRGPDEPHHTIPHTLGDRGTAGPHASAGDRGQQSGGPGTVGDRGTASTETDLDNETGGLLSNAASTRLAKAAAHKLPADTNGHAGTETLCASAAEPSAHTEHEAQE